jgi:hypothetical protein
MSKEDTRRITEKLVAMVARNAWRTLVRNRGGVTGVYAAAVVMRLISLNAATFSTIRTIDEGGKSGFALTGWLSVFGYRLSVLESRGLMALPMKRREPTLKDCFAAAVAWRDLRDSQ